MPGSHAGMAGFNSLLYFQFQFPANAGPKRQQVSAQALVSLPAQVPTCACCVHLGSKAARATNGSQAVLQVHQVVPTVMGYAAPHSWPKQKLTIEISAR